MYVVHLGAYLWRLPSNGQSIIRQHTATIMRPVSAEQTAHRLAKLQSILAPEEALLLVGGVDGKNHAGSREALNWLLTGLNGRDIFGFTHLDGDLDESLLVVMADAVRLYAPAPLWAKIQPRLGRWRRLQVWTPPAAIADDTEAVEEHKIRSFIEMTRDLGSVGVALPAADAGVGPAAAVEKWPVVQSYALQDFEGATGGGFFTQVHAVRGVGEAVRALLVQLDAPSLAWLAHAEAPRLNGCLAACLATLDAACDAGRPLRTSEADLYEPALTYWAHGQLRAGNVPATSAIPSYTPSRAADAADAANAVGGGVALWLGARTGALAARGAVGGGGGGGDGCSEARVGEPDGPEGAPRHLCAELAEPLGPIYAARTYFLGTGARAPPRPPSEVVEELISATEGAEASPNAAPRKRTGARAAIAAAAAAADASAMEDARCADSDMLQAACGAKGS